MKTVGPFGLGLRNDRGERLISWCDANNLTLVNTWYRKHKRLLWTWKSPDSITKNQIDYIAINKRFRNAVTDAKTYPGSDCNSDHVPIIANMRFKLKILKKQKIEPQRDLNLLRKNAEMKERYRIEVENKYNLLENEVNIDGEESINRDWRLLQEALNETTVKLVPQKERTRRHNWMTEEILAKMEERRLCKGRNEDGYREINTEIRQDCDAAKENWLRDQCQEIEEMERNHHIEKMHGKIKEVTGRKRNSRSNTVKNKEGEIIMEIKEVLKVWEEYAKDLFEDEGRGDLPMFNNELEGPEILEEEIRYAMKTMKKGKSAGNDKITIEMIEASGDYGLRKITELTNKIYDTGFIPEEMAKSIFIVIPKKPGTIECSQHRTISLMSQLTKIILKVILNRIRRKIQSEIAEVQYGFMQGKGTRNAIFIVRTILERMIEMQQEVYMCFIDFEKAFDRVKHADLIEILQNINLDGKDIRLITNLYWKQIATVNIDIN